MKLHLLCCQLDTFYFDQPTYVITEGSDDENVTIAMVNLTFSIELRYNTSVQFRYDDLTAIGKLLTLRMYRSIWFKQ